jgi:hypothetical protein
MFVNPANYPLDVVFVEQIPMPVQERLRRLGSFEPRTLFFQIPFCAISGAGAGIIRDYEHRCYYQFFCATRGVIDGLPDEVLRVVIEHELHEIRDTTYQATSSPHNPAFTTHAEEKVRHVPEFEAFATKYGKGVADRSVTELRRLASNYPTIPRYINLFWLATYAVSMHQSLSAFAHAMTDVMLSPEQRNEHKSLLDKVRKDYGGRLPFPVYARLWVATVKSKMGSSNA